MVSIVCLVDFRRFVGVGVSCSVGESVISGLLLTTLLPVAPVSIIGNELRQAPSSDLRASVLLVITLLGKLFDLLQIWWFCPPPLFFEETRHIFSDSAFSCGKRMIQVRCF